MAGGGRLPAAGGKLSSDGGKMGPAAAHLLLFLPAGFLSGSVPFGLLLVRLAGKGDLRSVGSGNIGATNAARAGGRWLGALTLALDAAKGFVPVFLAGRLADGCFAGGGAAFAPITGAALAPITGTALAPTMAAALPSLVALAAVLGHAFTPWLRFRGGKGVATALGALGAALAFQPWAHWMLLPPLGVFMAAVALTRYVSLGSVLAAIALPVSLLAGLLAKRGPGQPLSEPALLLAPWLAIAALVVAKHGPNMARLLRGTESPLWGAKSAKSAKAEKAAEEEAAGADE
jgi:glycerol-3-phosphate acyltransferase PlsY